MNSVIIEKYNARVDTIGSLLCVGLDSSLDRLPARFLAEEHPQFTFNRHIIQQTYAYAAAFKPNIAFYEARGAAGLTDLALTMDYLREHHPYVLTICDAKRADIGSTNEGYVTAILDHLGFDAVTLNPYLGRAALAPFLARADKGCILLCRTSNPGAGEFQDLDVGGKPLWQVVAEQVSQEWNSNGNCMLVAGATYPDELAQIRALVGAMPLLVPGIGAQGGDVEKTVRAGLDSDGQGLIINSSRGIIFAADPGVVARDLRTEINGYRW
ncbi:orotidine-5'-phosphate decarboxylase [Chloroflexota bacterium]